MMQHLIEYVINAEVAGMIILGISAWMLFLL
jgi:hypothetical protein